MPFALKIRELMIADPVGSRALVRDRIRSVVDYCAKLGRRRRDDGELDLFTVLPTSLRARADGSNGGTIDTQAPTRCMS